jgi:aminobenzoyl-glutamate utilization protein A
MDIYEQIIICTDEIAGQLAGQRRDFHKYAEKGWFEMRTSSIIARKLTELGYEVLTGDQVCLKEARMGLPSEAELDAHYGWRWRTARTPSSFRGQREA